MRPNRVYLLHPGPQSHPAIAGWIIEVEQFLRADPSWNEWDIDCVPYNERNGFDVQPLFARVLRNPGPVLLLENVQSKPLGDLREKLRAHTIVLLKSPGDSTDLWEAVSEARRRHEALEPLWSRKLVVAILIVRKLRNLRRWGGNAKGYLWGYDLAKGRGLDEKFIDVASEVANTLFLHQVLIKKTSQGLPKYALNPDRKDEVYAIANNGTFWNRRLEQIFMRDHREESASYLREPHEAIGFTITAEGRQPYECVKASDAIKHVKACPDGVRYEARVHFQNDHKLSDNFDERRILLQFLEAFR